MPLLFTPARLIRFRLLHRLRPLLRLRPLHRPRLLHLLPRPLLQGQAIR